MINLYFSICGSINRTCGQSPVNQCANKSSGCCGACQTWVSDVGFEGACLGTVFKSAEKFASTYFLTYSNGDLVYDGRSRDILIMIGCGNETVKVVSFKQPEVPPYDYVLTVTSKYVCSCSYATTCNSCTNDNECYWCMDNNSCEISTSNCKNYIKNPQYCPLGCVTLSTCNQCTLGNCAWCIGENVCVPLSKSDQCINGVVESPSFCEKEE